MQRQRWYSGRVSGQPWGTACAAPAVVQQIGFRNSRGVQRVQRQRWYSRSGFGTAVGYSVCSASGGTAGRVSGQPWGTACAAAAGFGDRMAAALGSRQGGGQLRPAAASTPARHASPLRCAAGWPTGRTPRAAAAPVAASPSGLQTPVCSRNAARRRHRPPAQAGRLALHQALLRGGRPHRPSVGGQRRRVQLGGPLPVSRAAACRALLCFDV